MFLCHGETFALERQEADCRALAERRGWEVIEPIYRDNDTSATSGKVRKDWKRLLAGLEAGEVDAIIAYSSSRMYRRPADLNSLLDLVKGRPDFPIETVASGRINLSTVDGRMIAKILADVDEAEAERIGERVRNGMAKLSADGAYTGGGARPFGYVITGGKKIDGKPARVTVDKAEAAVLRSIVEAALRGESLYRIAATLNGRTWIPPGEGGSKLALRARVMRNSEHGSGPGKGITLGTRKRSFFTPSDLRL